MMARALLTALEEDLGKLEIQMKDTTEEKPS